MDKDERIFHKVLIGFVMLAIAASVAVALLHRYNPEVNAAPLTEKAEIPQADYLGGIWFGNDKIRVYRDNERQVRCYQWDRMAQVHSPGMSCVFYGVGFYADNQGYR